MCSPHFLPDTEHILGVDAVICRTYIRTLLKNLQFLAVFTQIRKNNLLRLDKII